MRIKQPPSYTMKNDTTELIANNATRTDLSVPSYAVNFDDTGASLMSNFISEREPVLRLAYLVVLSVATGMGNLLVLVAVLKFPSLRRPTNAMLGSLALSDFLVGTVTVPLYTAWTTRPGIFDRSVFMCALVLLSCLMVVTASQVSLLLLSVEQYLAVCHPFRHRNILIGCPRLHSYGIVFAWASSFLTAAVSLLAYEKKPKMSCNYYSVFDETFLFVASIFGVFFPFALIIYFNVRVLCVVKEHEKKMSFAYRRDDNYPILRKKDRAERASYSLSSSKTDGSLCDPTHRLSSAKGPDAALEIFNYSDRESLNFLDDTVQRKMSRTKKSVREKFSRIRASTEESEIDMETTADVTASFIDELRNDDRTDLLRSLCVGKDRSLQVVVENFAESNNNADNISFKSIESLLLCDWSVLLEERAKSIKAVNGLNTKENETHAGQEKNDTTPTRRWSLPSGNNVVITSFKSLTRPLDRVHRYVTIGDFTSQCNNINKSSAKKSLSGMNGKQTFQNYQRPRGLQSEKRRNSLPQPQNSRDILKATSCTTLLIYKPKNSFSKHLSHLRSSLAKSTPLLSNIGLSDCFHEKLFYLKPTSLKSLNNIFEPNKEGQVNFDSYNYQSNTNLNNERKPNPLNYLSNVDAKGTCVNRMINPSGGKNELSTAERFVFCNKNNNVQTYTLLDLPTIKDITKDNDDILSLSHIDNNDLLWKFVNQKVDETPQTVNVLNFFPDLKTRELSEIHGGETENLVKGNDLSCRFNSKGSAVKRKRSTDNIEEITVFKDPNDAEVSIDSGISVNNCPDNLDTDEANKNTDVTEVTHAIKKANVDGEKIEKKGKTNWRLPLVSASESFRGLRLKRRLRSLSFSSVGVSQKVRWMVALVCATFILAWFPFFAVILANMFCDSCKLTYFLNTAIMVAFSKSMANPVVYALCHVEFRRAYAKVFKAIGLKSCC